MDTLETILPTKLFEVLNRNSITTLKQVVCLSIRDITKLTNLSVDDIKLIKSLVSKYFQPECITCERLLSLKTKDRVTTGCYGIDCILNGGFRRGTITEIYGESGSGKTQIAIQATVSNWSNGCVYICTEDLFPIKRYEHMKISIPNYDPCINYGQNTFVEHITESDDLITCIRVRLPKLLLKNNIALIIIDSIAAPFRVDSINYVQRAQKLRELANLLINISKLHNLAVLCINQVTAAFGTSDKDIIPSLGLAWSNMICTRLWLKRLNLQVSDTYSKLNSAVHTLNVRELSVEFSPEIPHSIAKFVITPSGIRSFL